ncbi:glycoside hydrolase family 65, partial [Candidatus Sumerlaeota bacterium]|nr:glycoside hydrolase family 65 [Candidatus Sumerlaeota bacterium]
DQIAFRIQSPLIAAKRLKVRLRFPYANGAWGRDPADWSHPEKHQTTMSQQTPTRVTFRRIMDEKNYCCCASFSGDGRIEKKADHEYALIPSGSADAFEGLITFQESGDAPDTQDFQTVADLAATHWENFWTAGGAIDLSESKDPRWKELERRIVLSQYLTAIQCAQKYPPQETGLTCNSWFGKFHLEMHWWHGVHFALWNRLDLLERSLDWYNEILPAARDIAKRQGYKGVRWPKMTNPNGEDSPSGIGPMLIWQQPHPIYYAELVYRQKPTKATLDAYQNVVFETAEFMADFAHWDETGKRYVLGPPVIPAQENYKLGDTWNPTYELCYWQWGLETAQQWRERMGLARNEKWDNVIQRLSPLPVRDGVYTAIEPEPYTNTTDHPSMLGALGMLPETPLVDPEIMRKTAQHVYETWQWSETWGWDYPMLAMSAARTGLPELAVDALFIDSPKNRYGPNGHNYQRENLPLYLPGNGGLLTAVAMMAAGWDGAPDVHAPGFPKNGRWIVKWEGLKRMP